MGGCGLTQKASEDISKKAALVPKGLLSIRILDANLLRDTSVLSSMNPFVKMRLTSHSYKTKVIQGAGKAPNFNEEFYFFINSDSIAEGRILQLAVLDHGSAFTTQVGYGIIDCDPVIMNKVASYNQKCYIVYDRKPAGYVNLHLSFQEELVGVLFIHVLNASIRRKTSILSSMVCQARVSIGEEILVTEKSKETKDEAPHWKDVFHIPITRSIETGVIEILDIGANKAETLVGDCEISIKELIEPSGEGYHETYIWHKEVEAGNVKFITSFVNLEQIEPQKRQQFLEQKWLELAKREEEILANTNYSKSKSSRINSKITHSFDTHNEVPIQPEIQKTTEDKLLQEVSEIKLEEVPKEIPQEIGNSEIHSDAVQTEQPTANK